MMKSLEGFCETRREGNSNIWSVAEETLSEFFQSQASAFLSTNNSSASTAS